MNIETYLASLEGKHVAVMGIGVSNQPLIRLLRDHDVAVTARDRKTREGLGATAAELVDFIQDFLRHRELYFAMYIFLVCGEVNNAIEMILIELKLDFRMRKQKKMRKKAEKLEQKRAKQESKQSESGQQGSKKQADEKQGKR